ncbi:hypothetical protein ACC724_40065, partial [Rhizobium ruizarguesonis]
VVAALGNDRSHLFLGQRGLKLVEHLTCPRQNVDFPPPVTVYFGDAIGDGRGFDLIITASELTERSFLDEWAVAVKA